jgi:hypothetical protein
LKGGLSMPKQPEGKPGKPIDVAIHFPNAELLDPKESAALEKHLKEKLIPELVKGHKERTGKDDLAQFNTCKAQQP